MDVSEKWGTDVDTAVDLALAELKCTREEVEITVLEQPSRGFFGIGSKLALVRVEKKAPVVVEEPVVVVKEEEFVVDPVFDAALNVIRHDCEILSCSRVCLRGDIFIFRRLQ